MKARLPSTRILLFCCMALGGCKVGNRETFIRPQNDFEVEIRNTVSISSGKNIVLPWVEGQEASRRAKGLFSDTGGKALVRISVRRFYGSEGDGEDILFLHDSADFEYLNLSSKSGRKVYYHAGSMDESIGPSECRYFRIRMSKTIDANWHVEGLVSCEIETWGQAKIRKLKIDGIFGGAG